MANPTTGRNRKGGYFLSGLYPLASLVRLSLPVPGTEVPACIALKVPEPHKPHHCTTVISHGEAVNQQLFVPIISVTT